MASTVNVPAVGPVKTRWLLVGGAVVAVIVTGAYIMRARRGSGGVTYDPATGSVGGGAYVNPNPDPDESGVPVGSENVIDTNAEWGSEAITRLESLGYEPVFAGVAIGKYLSEQPVTQGEAEAIRTAWAMLGKPPVNAPPIHLVQTGPAPGTPPPGGSTTRPPARPVPRRYYLRPDGTRHWKDPDMPGQYAGNPIRVSYAGKAPRRYRLLNPPASHPRVWLDPYIPGRYSGDTERVA